MATEPKKMQLESSNEAALRDFFSKYGDVKIECVHQACVIYCEGLINEDYYVELFGSDSLVELLAGGGKGGVAKCIKISNQTTLEELAVKIFNGFVACCIYETGEFYLISIFKKPSRSIEESTSEIAIRGPRESFVEDINLNVALIRKRLKTSNLCLRMFTIGSETQTSVGLLFLDNIINTDILNEAVSRLNRIEVEALNSVNQLEEFISDKSAVIAPLTGDTTRPDFVVEALLGGRFAILVDNCSRAIIAPANLSFLLKSPEDLHFPYYAVSVGRFFRLCGILLAVLLPGFWLALISYHQDQIPFSLLATVTMARIGLPLPAPMEILTVFLLLELFREAGARLPATIGQTLTVVGGLIIGDSAIRAGFISPSVIVVVALSTLASYTVVNQQLSGVVTILRMFVLIFSSLFGLFGFYAAFFSIIIYLSFLRSFGVPYLAFLSSGSMTVREAIKTFFKPPLKYSSTRPKFLHTRKPFRRRSD